jgi:hypothetical protein
MESRESSEGNYETPRAEFRQLHVGVAGLWTNQVHRAASDLLIDVGSSDGRAFRE